MPEYCQWLSLGSIRFEAWAESSLVVTAQDFVYLSMTEDLGRANRGSNPDLSKEKLAKHFLLENDLRLML